MESEQKKIKPFSMILTDVDIRNIEGEEGVQRRRMKKPFIIDETMVQEKEYLLLLVFTSDDYEDEKTFEFITGTSSTVYKYIRNLMGKDNEVCLDVKKSMLLVDSPKVSLSKRVSVYKFMKNTIATGKVIEDTGFDIDEFYYQDEDDNSEEM